jgi:hypothetical protein
LINAPYLTPDHVRQAGALEFSSICDAIETIIDAAAFRQQHGGFPSDPWRLRRDIPVLLALRRNKEDNARIPGWAFSTSAAVLL